MKQISFPLKIIISISIFLVVSLIGGFAMKGAMSEWYLSLEKAPFNPPDCSLALIWSFLCVLMGLAASLIWQDGLDKVANREALTYFGLQFLLNGLWAVIFFGLMQPSWAFIEIIILWILLFLTTSKFYKIDKTAGYLMIPYLLWVTFMLVFNGSISILN